MKAVVTSFSMTLSQAQDLAEATARVKNRSAWINDAIEKKILKMNSFNLADIGDRQLTLHFHHRFCDRCDDPTIEFMTCPIYQTLAKIAER